MIESELPPEFFEDFADMMDAYYASKRSRPLHPNAVKVSSTDIHPERFTDWDIELKKLVEGKS